MQKRVKSVVTMLAICISISAYAAKSVLVNNEADHAIWVRYMPFHEVICLGAVDVSQQKIFYLPDDKRMYWLQACWGEQKDHKYFCNICKDAPSPTTLTVIGKFAEGLQTLQVSCHL